MSYENDVQAEIAKLKKDVWACDEGIRQLQTELDRTKNLSASIERERAELSRELLKHQALKDRAIEYFVALENLRAAVVKVAPQ